MSNANGQLFYMDIYHQIAANNRRTALILLLFFLVVLGIVAIAMLIIDLPLDNFPIISAWVFGGLLLWTFISWRYGQNMILSFVGAKLVERKTHFEIYNLVENIAITAGLPNPMVYIIEDNSLNAFATGRNPKNSVVCLTTGIIKRLNKRELEGVIAHEMGHIANYDIRLELILITVIGLISVVGEILLRIRGGRNNKGTGYIALAGLFIYLIGAPLLRLIRLALSRNREFLADSTGSFYTRDPEALALALEKISKDARIESADHLSSAAHLFIADPSKNPGESHAKKLHRGAWLLNLFATHPPIDERIHRLRGK